MEYSLETQQLSEFAASVGQYLEKIRQIDSNIRAEEVLPEVRAPVMPEWRHTLRFYTPAGMALVFVFVVIPVIAFGIRSVYRWIGE